MIKHLLTLTVAIALGGCGGGSGTASETTTSKATTSADLLGAKKKLAAAAAPAAATAVSPDEAARQLMDFAEARYPQYFPIHTTTGSSLPFAYRYYPSTGIYLGVVVTADMGYINNGVYVMGGAFGNAPLYVGLLTDFITPVDPGSEPSGQNNGCDDFSLAAIGTRVIVEYENVGTVTGTETWDRLVAGMKTFGGHQAIEQIDKTVTRTTASDGSSQVHEGESRTFALPTGDAEISHYGVVILSKSDIGAITLTNNIQSVYSPPWIDRQYGLAVGESYTSSATGTNTSTVSGFPGIPDSTSTTPFTDSSTTKYIGRESVTVPAGTYNTCRHESGQTADGVFTQWTIVGKGITVKTQTTDKGVVVQSSQATSVRVNGQPI